MCSRTLGDTCDLYPRQVIDLDNQWRECRGRIDDLNKAKNLFQKEVTKAKKAGGEDPENAAKIKETVKEIKTVEVKMGEFFHVQPASFPSARAARPPLSSLVRCCASEILA